MTASRKKVCPLCACGAVRDLYTVRGTDLVRCPSCTLVFVDPMPADDDLRDLYQNDYFQSTDHLHWGYENYFSHEDEVRGMARYRLGLVKKYISAGKFLDDGCATGWFLDEARNHGFDIQGVEISRQAAEWGISKLKLPIHIGTLGEAAFEAESFDAAALWNVFEHLVDPFSELDEVSRVLKPGGFFFVTVPDQGSLLARLMGKRWFGYSKVVEHLYFFNRATLSLALDKAGFDVTRIQLSPYMVDLDFLGHKLGQYSGSAARLFNKVTGKLGIGEKKINISLVDILAVARKR